MKAVRFHQHGGVEVLRYEDAPDPVAHDGRALIRVRACALNHLDLWERRGIERVTLPLPHISGSDIAGEVIEPGSSGLAPGTRVMLQPGLRCGRCRACTEGRDNQCTCYDVLGLQSDGGYAQSIAVPAENLHGGIENAVAGLHLTILTKQAKVSNDGFVSAGFSRPGNISPPAGTGRCRPV